MISSIVIENNNITFELYNDLDSQSFIMIIILDFQNNIHIKKIIDIDIYEKYYYNNIL